VTPRFKGQIIDGNEQAARLSVLARITCKGNAYPRKIKNEPKATKSNGTSFRGAMNSAISMGLLKGGVREVTVRFAMIIMKRIRKAMIRICVRMYVLAGRSG